ncbi:hypothetical protein [Sanguibacter gelidistatuariae]|uniref:hypothetical protein n=1 Tax=Sanguibacter gelidistatuariae TaxID=1814289 RepID=UPI000B89E24C|nr:hypothetical protein [Sanguibacter gelidistatuariae]
MVLLGTAASGIAATDRAGLGRGGPDAASTGCSVAQVHPAPILDYSPADKVYVISAVTFDAVPDGCDGRAYRLTFTARSGAPLLEMSGVLGESTRRVSIPEASQPPAETVTTTTLTVLAEDSAS